MRAIIRSRNVMCLFLFKEEEGKEGSTAPPSPRGLFARVSASVSASAREIRGEQIHHAPQFFVERI